MLAGALETTRLEALLPIELTIHCQTRELVFISVPQKKETHYGFGAYRT
jgi:hypothetical protein